MIWSIKPKSPSIGFTLTNLLRFLSKLFIYSIHINKLDCFILKQEYDLWNEIETSKLGISLIVSSRWAKVINLCHFCQSMSNKIRLFYLNCLNVWIWKNCLSSANQKARPFILNQILILLTVWQTTTLVKVKLPPLVIDWCMFQLNGNIKKLVGKVFNKFTFFVCVFNKYTFSFSQFHSKLLFKNYL